MVEDATHHNGKRSVESLIGEQGPITTRRSWVRSVGGGILMAVGGLYLPDWLEDTAAREGAFGGELGGRRGPDHRGRDKNTRRDHGSRNRDRKHDKRPEGFRGVFLYIYNSRQITNPNQSASLEFWGGHNASSLFPEYRWEKASERTLANGDVTSENYLNIGLTSIVDGRYMIQAVNPEIATPFVRIDYGGKMTKYGNDGGTKALLVDLDENESTGVEVEGHSFDIHRLYDTSDFKVFDIHFT
ncbi:MAG: hypothetical protein U0031_17360 [Thermomicrobiales bacterium]